MPERVVFITDKNFASVGSKFVECFNECLGIDARLINVRYSGLTPEYVRDCFNIDHSRILALYYDPGDINGSTDKFNKKRIHAPPDVSWGLIRGSSFYRVDNLVKGMTLPHGTMIKKKNKRVYKIIKNDRHIQFGSRKVKRINGFAMKAMNKYFDSLTPLVMVGTEDLLGINKNNVFLGQPQRFYSTIMNKKPDSIGHITTPALGREYKKGTDKIQLAFSKLNHVMTTGVIGHPPVSHDACMDFLTRMGMSVQTMTDWDYGLGYVGLESMANGCLTMSKNSRYGENIGTKVINVDSTKDLIGKATYYHNNHDEFNSVRREQYDWARDTFSYPAVAERFMGILRTVIDDGWEVEHRSGLRHV